jgi:hypothetical protein
MIAAVHDVGDDHLVHAGIARPLQPVPRRSAQLHMDEPVDQRRGERPGDSGVLRPVARADDDGAGGQHEFADAPVED